jgi:hypothetical protein
VQYHHHTQFLKEEIMESMKEMIEKRAYHLFLKRGGLHGYHMQDWVQAEKEIKAEADARKKGETRPTASAPKAEPPQEAKAVPVSIARAYPSVSPKQTGKGYQKKGR